MKNTNLKTYDIILKDKNNKEKHIMTLANDEDEAISNICEELKESKEDGYYTVLSCNENKTFEGQ